jgi:microcompartment protein CcmL/EutN
LSDGRDPAIALLEFGSISAGIVAGDAMVKASPVGSMYAGTVHPGRYLVFVSGDTASVEVAIEAGRDAATTDLVDLVFLPDIHESVVAAIGFNRHSAMVGSEALGIVEARSVASILDAADAGVKAADVELVGLRLADGLGGKGYVLLSGSVADVEVGVAACVDRLELHGSLVRSDVIAQLHDEMADNLRSDLTFLNRVSGGGGTS